MKFTRFLLLAGLIAIMPNRTEAQWSFGGSSEFFVPVGELSKVSLVGVSFGIYTGTRIGRSPWALQADAGLQWFIPDLIPIEDAPDWVTNPNPNNRNELSMSGTFIPIRGSITRFFGRYYVSPRVGVYIPTGDFTREADLKTSFGVAPRIGYFFPISRSVQFDFAFEYDYQFSDPVMQYFGVSLGVFFGGRRLSRGYRHAY